MKNGIAVKAGKGLKIFGTPDRKSPIEAGISNPKAVSNVITVPRRLNFTETLQKLHHSAAQEGVIVGKKGSFHPMCFSTLRPSGRLVGLPDIEDLTAALWERGV